ncbi:hypothetical protein FNJ84_06355 [Paracoccus sp. M683]|uniref:chloride channel protein n=1 Tax=Paracoccus sp. M683 TaxID=2594268 RepID=UPI00117DDD54|nr:chloride channel protein [Paracoccus sp. M683]TRW98395.1 hypothetical protein FNJ84_06355 [Paracoccus sp. M683]
MPRPILTSLLFGLAAGMVTAVTLWLMHLLEQLLWQGEASALRVAVTIMAGAVLIAAMRIRLPHETLESQLDDSRDGRKTGMAKAGMLAALGIVSVGFGGAIGPEAGILAVVAELSALISARIARDVQEARLIGQIGAAGALGGLYGSPPGGASYANDKPDAPWPLLVLAALAGLGGMMLAGLVLPEGPGLRVALPPAPRFEAMHMIPAILAGLAGSLAGTVFVLGAAGFARLMAALSRDVRVQVLVGSAIFALLAAIFPDLRFNGQHEMANLAEAGVTLGVAYLAGLAVLKALALALCLSAHWLGGPIMPLALAGSAAGIALAAVVPGVDVGVAAAAGMAACCTVGMNRPAVVLLVLIFMASGTALMPILVGVMAGWLIAQTLPSERVH